MDRLARERGSRVLLDGRTAVVYGGAGAIGSAVAKAFAREGARVFLAGRTRSTLEAVAADIASAGGSADAGVLDALEEGAVDEHADAIARATGGIDVSFNAIGHGDVHGMSLLDMPYDDFARPVATAVRTQFLTGRAAARHMVRRGSGVILAITATTARLTVPNVGGTGVAFDAIEGLCRQMARELGPFGVRVLWLRTTGIPEALHQSETDLGADYGTGERMTRDDHIAWMEGQTMLRRLTSLADVGAAAAFAASDLAGSLTGCAVNLTAGAVRD